MTLNDEQWGDLKDKVFEKFLDADSSIDLEEAEDDIGHKYNVRTENLIFSTPMGELKIERVSRPKILDKKAHYHKGSGGAKVEFVFSEDEKTHTVSIFKKDTVTGEWLPFDMPGEGLSF